ncbi:MAG: hypothetical protein LQ339_005271 [Xanthoria mediterranea]|nr:MAG: hypothetical protein LQ339_005271 [Xanthoria mediterranea]
MPSSTSEKHTKHSVRRYLAANISTRHADLPLLACCFVTGIIDAGAYNAWGTFMGMQTGNTIFLALGVADLPINRAPLQWLRSLLAIFSFIMGSLVSSAIARPFGPTRRLSLSISFLLQGISILLAAIFITTDVIPTNDTRSNRVMIGIPVLAWQFGAQVAASRALGYNEIPTTVLTSVYNDLATDPRLWTWKNAKRNRRAAAAVLVLAGGIAGGWLSRLRDGFSIVLWIAGAIKVTIGLAWLAFGEAIADGPDV